MEYLNILKQKLVPLKHQVKEDQRGILINKHIEDKSKLYRLIFFGLIGIVLGFSFGITILGILSLSAGIGIIVHSVNMLRNLLSAENQLLILTDEDIILKTQEKERKIPMKYISKILGSRNSNSMSPTVTISTLVFKEKVVLLRLFHPSANYLNHTSNEIGKIFNQLVSEKRQNFKEEPVINHLKKDFEIQKNLEAAQKAMNENLSFNQSCFLRTDIENCLTIIEDFSGKMLLSDSEEAGQKLIRDAILDLKDLNAKCRYTLIEQEQRQIFDQILTRAYSLKGYDEYGKNLTADWWD